MHIPLFVPNNTQVDDLHFIICRIEADGTRLLSVSKYSFNAWNHGQLLIAESLQGVLAQPGSWLAWRASPQLSSPISRVWYDQPLQGYFAATPADRCV